MISRILAAELPEHVGERVTIAGWLHRRRELKSVTFLIIRDRTGLAQVVLPPEPPGLPPTAGGDGAPGRGPRRGKRRRHQAVPSSPSRC